MAFERIGIGGFLTFDEKKGVASMGRAGAAFGKLGKKAVAVGKGIANVGKGVRTAGLAFLPITAGLGLGLAIAAGFEKQMSAVGAITRGTTEDMTRLTDEAKRQGIVSVFSATESAQAMEALGRAGFDTTQVISALGGVMNAAAAEGIGLGESATIVSRIVKSMGLEVERANNIADILVLTSAKSNTNITSLGEAFKFGAPAAKGFGIQTEELASVFGKLADSGLDASQGGTSFANFLLKLGKPSKEAARQMKAWKIELEDSQGNLKSIGNIIEQFKSKIEKIPSATERARVASELFGVRGQRAYVALASAGGKAIDDLTQDLLESSFGIGAAAEAAEKRLDNLAGSFTLFKSSVESIFIGFFDPLLTPFKEATQDITAGLNRVLDSFAGLQKNQKAVGMASVAISKRQIDAQEKRNDSLKGLSERQKKAAKVALASFVVQASGEQKLTRAQEASRAASLSSFVVSGLARQDLSAEELGAQKEEIEGLAAIAKTRRLTTAEQLTLRDKVLGSIEAQISAVDGTSKADQATLVGFRKASIERLAAQGKIEAKIEGAINRRKRLQKIEEEQGSTARLIAEGVLEGLDAVKEGFASVVDSVRRFGKSLAETVGEDRLKQFFKIATIALTIAAAIAPVILGFSALAFVIGAVAGPIIAVGGVVITVVTGIGSAFLAVFTAIKVAALSSLGALGPFLVPVIAVVLAVVAVLGILVGAFLLIRKENESIGDTFIRVWGAISDFVTEVFNDFLTGWGMIFDAVDDLTGGFLGDMVAKFTGFLSGLITKFTDLVPGLGDTLASPFILMFDRVEQIFSGIKDLFAGDFKTGLKKIGLGILDVILLPFRGLIGVLSRIADKILSKFGAAVPKGIAKSLRSFQAFGSEFAKEGVSGSLASFGGTVGVKTKDKKEEKKETDKVFGGFKKRDEARLSLEAAGLEINEKNLADARAILARQAQEVKDRKKAEFEAAKKKLTADVKLEDKRQTTVNANLCVDGQTLNVASARQEQTIFERTGATTEPFMRRQVQETGTRVPVSARG